MKKILVVMMFVLGSIGFSNEYLDKMVGTWYDEYGYILKIEKNNGKYYKTLRLLDGGLEGAEEEDIKRAPLIYKKELIKLIDNKYIDVFNENEDYAFLERGKLFFINIKTKKAIFDSNLNTRYYMFK